MGSFTSTNIDRIFGDLYIRRIAGRLGGEVLNVKLNARLDDEVVAAIDAALVRHKVLFFRGQTQLSDREQEAFGARFGRVVAHPTVPAIEGLKLLELDASRGGGRADSWHTDVTFVEAFPKISILRGVNVPVYGGDTVWANTAAAYEQLPAELRTLADRLWAVHSNEYDYAGGRELADPERLRHYREVFASAVFEAEHPLVHVHPVSGERALLLGHFIRRISGLSSAESARIFEILQARATALENTVRWTWQKDDVAIWDNRATQHYAINDYGDQPRVMRRITVEGERAVSVDGQRSRTRRRPDAVNDQRIDAALARAA